ncbi:MAG: hypothetical protein NTX45_28485, partial [Proteobacteria bacterium]|nr:hypothetical protein [Pseudomonadota bacterium]
MVKWAETIYNPALAGSQPKKKRTKFHPQKSPTAETVGLFVFTPHPALSRKGGGLDARCYRIDSTTAATFSGVK